MDWNKPPTLKGFAESFQDYLNEVYCMDNPDGFIASHKIKGDIRIQLDDDEDETEFEIVGLDVDQMMGCGCPSGVVIRIKKSVDL